MTTLSIDEIVYINLPGGLLNLREYKVDRVIYLKDAILGIAPYTISSP
jgi:hypothetical protein